MNDFLANVGIVWPALVAGILVSMSHVPLGQQDGLHQVAGEDHRSTVGPVADQREAVPADGPQPAGQVCDEKTNVCKPLLTHRNNPTMASELGMEVAPGMKARPARRALSQAAACVLAWRCSVYRWRELVAGAGMEQENLSPR